MLYVSGHGPNRLDGGWVQGKVGEDMTVADARKAARMTALAMLSTVESALGECMCGNERSFEALECSNMLQHTCSSASLQMKLYTLFSVHFKYLFCACAMDRDRKQWPSSRGRCMMKHPLIMICALFGPTQTSTPLTTNHAILHPLTESRKRESREASGQEFVHDQRMLFVFPLD